MAPTATASPTDRPATEQPPVIYDPPADASVARSDAPARAADRPGASRPARQAPAPWRMPTRAIAWRLFLTCWLVYALHFTTDVVREHYPAIALGDRFSFNLEGYCGLHPDLFETPGRGCHIGNNPGVSMLAAIPYALARPVIDPVSRMVVERRRASGQTEPPAYNTEFPNRRAFLQKVWALGLDIKLGLAALVMQVFCMALTSALFAVALFYLLRQLFASDKVGLWLSLLYAFGTPVFFRTGFLNHNMMLGHIAFMGMLLMWNPFGMFRWSERTRYLLAGVCGGATILFDYSGVVFIVGLCLYGAIKVWRAQSFGEGFRRGVWYFFGTLPPVFLLWLYQYKAFGNPFLPGQHWMPPVQWIDRGYQGYGFPQGELFWMLGFDHRFGLFVSAPILLLALAAPFVNRGEARRLPAFEERTMLLLFLGLWVFFAGSNYTRLEFNTGVRYMAPIVPFLFVPAAIVLMRMRLRAVYYIAVASVVLAWSMAMYRKVERPLGVLDPVVRLFTKGFTLPAFDTLSRIPGFAGDFFAGGVSVLPLFCLAGAILYGLWSRRLQPDGGAHAALAARPPAHW